MSLSSSPALAALDPLDSGPYSFAGQEDKVLAFWTEIDAFGEQLKQSEGKPPYTFYDGPPFATGLPHFGHLLVSSIKDVVTRFAHSKGFHVERRFGWDTHGLPVEHEIDKKLGITSKADVMEMGIDKYNAECRAIVMRYSADWRRTIERLGRWIDFDNDYKTLNTPYMESVWWVFGELWKKNLVYRGLKVMPYTTGCTTPLSNFEAGQAYKDVQDPAVTVSFPLVDDPTVSLLAWTTTPWTLPSNLAVCVHPELTYIKIHDQERDAKFILCDQLLGTLYKDVKKAKYTVLASYKGKEMAGWKYVPLFPYYTERYAEKGFKVLTDPYVTSDSGTGIVHQAPAFGEEDHRIAIKEGIITKEEMPPCPINETGHYTSEVLDFEGQYVKDADKVIMKHLKGTGRLIVQATITHSYPFCWRSGTPLIYRVIPVWFIKVQESTDKLVANNKATTWVPASVGENRFQGWLQNARDWNVSRNRYWGTPLPLWANEDYSEVVCVGSIEELDALSGCGTLLDIHRDKIDHITIPAKKGPGVLRRVEEVFDCWFESGSMPYAQVHYPFENKAKFESSFPADFISEAIDQTRGWFYTLLVLSTHLFDTAPWKNLIVCGHILAADGKKMSKSLKNYPDPNLIVEAYGADALRLFLINSPVVRGESLRFREEGVKEVISRFLLPFLNSYRFFLGQVALLKKTSGVEFKYDPKAAISDNVMDQWILARCQSLIQWVEEEMKAYRMYTVVGRMLGLIDELTNWYIRFNRRRLKGDNGIADATAALQTLFETLFTLARTLSAFIPFLTENIYQGLRTFFPADTASLEIGADTRSLHFLPFPAVRMEYFNPVIERQVTRLQTVIDLARVVRERTVLPLKTPLKELIIYHPSAEYLDDIRSLQSYIEQELNVRAVVLTSDDAAVGIKYKAHADWSVLGRKVRKEMAKVKAGLLALSSDEVKAFAASGKMTVAGIELGTEDITAVRYVESAETAEAVEGAPKYEANTDSDVTILLDVLLRPELEAEGRAREVVNRIQQLRKKAGCVATDDIDVYYSFAAGMGQALAATIVGNAETFQRVLKRVPMAESERDQSVPILMEEETEVGEDTVRLVLVRA